MDLIIGQISPAAKSLDPSMASMPSKAEGAPGAISFKSMMDDRQALQGEAQVDETIAAADPMASCLTLILEGVPCVEAPTPPGGGAAGPVSQAHAGVEGAAPAAEDSPKALQTRLPLKKVSNQKKEDQSGEQLLGEVLTKVFFSLQELRPEGLKEAPSGKPDEGGLLQKLEGILSGRGTGPKGDTSACAVPAAVPGDAAKSPGDKGEEIEGFSRVSLEGRGATGSFMKSGPDLQALMPLVLAADSGRPALLAPGAGRKAESAGSPEMPQAPSATISEEDSPFTSLLRQAGAEMLYDTDRPPAAGVHLRDPGSSLALERSLQSLALQALTGEKGTGPEEVTGEVTWEAPVEGQAVTDLHQVRRGKGPAHLEEGPVQGSDAARDVSVQKEKSSPDPAHPVKTSSNQNDDRIARVAMSDLVKLIPQKITEGPMGKTIRLSLDPPTLGEMTVKISMHDTKVHMEFQVSTGVAKNLLESNISQLLDNCLHSGIDVGGFDINHNSGPPVPQDRSPVNLQSPEPGRKEESPQPPVRAGPSGRLINLFV